MKFERLGNICTVRNGYAFKSELFNEDGVPVIRISDINGNYVTSENSIRTPYNEAFEQFKLSKGDILIAMSGATTGKYGIYSSEEVGYQNQRVGCFVIKDKSALDNNYLLQTLKYLKPKIERKAHGSGQPNISAKAIEDFEILLPSLPDQLHIANLLSKAENLIAQRKESIRLLDEFLKSTFLEMFGDPVRNEKGWEIGKFKNLATLDRKQVLPAEFTKQDFYIGLEDIEKETGNIIKTSSENAEDLKSSKFRFTPNHILYAKLRPYLNKVALPNQSGICSTDIFPVLPLEGKSNRFFICYLMRSKPFVTEMHSKSSGANLPRASASVIENFKTYQPPIELQTQFAQIVEKIEALKTQYQQSLQELENLYGSLSQKAFRGELIKK